MDALPGNLAALTCSPPGQSIFGDLVSGADAKRRQGASPCAEQRLLNGRALQTAGSQADVSAMPVPAAQELPMVQAPDHAAGRDEERTASGSAPHDPALAEIGIGPGMLMRLGQLGLKTRGDLARANAEQLRASLGDISRLIDVETWIASARRSADAPPPADHAAGPAPSLDRLGS